MPRSARLLVLSPRLGRWTLCLRPQCLFLRLLGLELARRDLRKNSIFLFAEFSLTLFRGAVVPDAVKHGVGVSGCTESDAFMKKVAAPYQLAALRSLKIDDYLEKPAAAVSTAVLSKPVIADTGEVSKQDVFHAASSAHSTVGSLASTRRTLAEVLGKVKGPVAPPTEVYLSDLETYKVA